MDWYGCPSSSSPALNRTGNSRARARPAVLQLAAAAEDQDPRVEYEEEDGGPVVADALQQQARAVGRVPSQEDTRHLLAQTVAEDRPLGDVHDQVERAARQADQSHPQGVAPLFGYRARVVADLGCSIILTFIREPTNPTRPFATA